MAQMEMYDFSMFTFNDLIDFVRDIQRTAKICSADYFKTQASFVSLDYLKQKMDLVAEELARRIKKAWHMDKIRRGCSEGVRLPSGLFNVCNIQPTTVLGEIFKQEPQIGAITNENGFDEIFFVFNRRKFIMRESGVIDMEA